MNIRDWLAEIGLDQFADAFEEEGIELDIIGDYTEEEFKQLGLKGGHCKRLLKAISALSDPPAEPQHQNEEAPLAALAQVLPSPVAFPLCEYLEEDHPGMKLWAACDTVELLLRLVVILSVAERQRAGTLDDKVLKQLQGKIEMPTLGAWMAMACSLAQSPASQDAVLPELSNLVLGPLSSLLYGPDNPGTADTSFLALRNRLAHGGGLNRKEAERLLDIWQKPFEGMVAGLSWLDDVRLMGRSGANAVVLRGRSSTVFDEAREPVDVMAANPDWVWLVRGSDSLGLWPLIRFDAPVAPNARGETRTGDSDATQVYVRKDLMHLHLTPLGTDDFSHSEVGDDAIESFQKLFQLDKAKRDSAEKGFKVQGFTREIQRDAAQMVGRFEEQAYIESSFLNLEQGVVWLTGPAGIGKSYLVARMASDLTERFAASNTLIMPYRFRSGDDTRCNRDAFANYVIERLVAEGALIEGSNIDEKGKAEDRLKSCLNYLAPDKKLILVLDGLDEIGTNDAAFAEEVPLALRYPRVVWVCAGRPEAALQEAFRINGAILPYPEGLPPMGPDDIRGMILEKIGPLRKKLLSGDKQQGDEVMNPFIELVAERAAGLPLYVKYVIGDVLANRYRVLDGNEEVPESLHAYHEQLIDRLGIGDLKAILTPLAATLAVAHEPLAEHELVTLMQMRKLITADDAGGKLIREGLAALAPMLRRAPDPEGEEGFTLFHASLREHMLSTPAMTQGIATARAAFAEAALNTENYPNIANYLYRAGVDHLLELDQIDSARVRLLDISVLQSMFALGKENQHILQYWLRIGDQNVADYYVEAVKAFVLNSLQESDLECLRNVVDLCVFAGWYLAGSEVARESLVVHEQMLGGEHPDTLTSVNNLGGLLRDEGDYDGAEPLCRRALEARERTLGGEHPDTLN
ncbi:MAG: tetratricopeptide repeat protein, partial [Luminiphilus sp.]|nr:tetratricopeptide repeat protein [Luminiphilus sp.]